MKINYDPEADAIYIYLSNKKSTKTEEIREDLRVDFNGKTLVGIEILDASKKLPQKEIDKVNLVLPVFKSHKPFLNS
ncbi:MAG: DUF2283 domain-containing protein [Patescibacteria group bacterium]|nr:DUF2283 domain-containing protein [Patescibacteria group bacterium]